MVILSPTLVGINIVKPNIVGLLNLALVLGGILCPNLLDRKRNIRVNPNCGEVDCALTFVFFHSSARSPPLLGLTTVLIIFVKEVCHEEPRKLCQNISKTIPVEKCQVQQIPTCRIEEIQVPVENCQNITMV